MAKTIKIDSEVMVVLERSVITETTLSLPNQLERSLYEKVSKVIKASGGKWNRSKATHIFDRDPREILGIAIDTGEIVNQQQLYQEVETPESLADRMVELADILPGDTVLEPSAGPGRIVRAAKAVGAIVTAVEYQEGQLTERDVRIVTGDFLDMAVVDLGQFDAVVMNPPFSNYQDSSHIRHAWEFVKPGGNLVAIASSGIKFRSDKRTTGFREWLNTIEATITDLPAGTFCESGTNVNTVMIAATKKGSR